ncbi:DUF1129 domain-containing protein [Marinilactibacillus piezotolerans]|uniref:DUF1129 domain-containing protein n=1 Tax=Marinilactibacillus piezotolerans TaxID=258723 RepID=UPI0009B079DB|nr:DUF1129 family protein [Marinilactibacillus piezotolerans]
MFNKKNKEAIDQPDKAAELETKKEENAQLFDQLTNKNSEYMMKLNRSLDDRRVSEERKTVIFNDMLKTIVEQQGQHMTARRIYGTVTEQADYLTENKTSSEQTAVVQSEPWKLYLDGALILGGMMTGITGIGQLFGTESTMRLFMVILGFLLGGFAFMIISKYAPVPGQKGGFLKYILATTGALIGFIFFMTLGGIIPDAINPVIPNPILLVIAVAAFAARWYLKRRLNIQGTIF